MRFVVPVFGFGNWVSVILYYSDLKCQPAHTLWDNTGQQWNRVLTTSEQWSAALGQSWTEVGILWNSAETVLEQS